MRGRAGRDSGPDEPQGTKPVDGVSVDGVQVSAGETRPAAQRWLRRGLPAASATTFVCVKFCRAPMHLPAQAIFFG